jgi:hypothetical protein
VLAGPATAARTYTDAMAASFGRYMPGAAALQQAMLVRPRTASAGVRLLTSPVVRPIVAGAWSLYWNALADGARPRPAAWAAQAVQATATRLAGSRARHAGTPENLTPGGPLGRPWRQ